MPGRVVGISGSYETRDSTDRFTLSADYFDAVEAAGGAPMLLPPVREEATLRSLLGKVDALLIPGGPDVPPARYGQERHEKTNVIHARRDEFDFRCLGAAVEMGLPVLAICYGTQMLNVFFGGTLIQDVPSQMDIEECHTKVGKKASRHDVRIEPGTKLAAVVGDEILEANSSHHQAIDRVGEGLRISARSPEGVIEAVETTDDRFILAVQWHPEGLFDEIPRHLKLFEALVDGGVGT